jgi:hypothetical protein
MRIEVQADAAPTASAQQAGVALREMGDEVHVHFFDLPLGRFRPGVDTTVQPFVAVDAHE